MPRSTRPAHYGPEYEHFLHAAATPEGFTLELPSPAHAITFRGKLYAYFKALRKANARPDLIALVDAVSLTVEGASLRAFPVEDSWDNMLLREALGIAKGAPLPAPTFTPPPAEPTAQEKLVAKLKELRERNSKAGIVK